MAKKGNDILIYSGGTLIAGTRSNEIQTDAELIEVSSATAGQWRSFITGRKQWSVSVAFLVLQDRRVAELLNVGNTVTLSVRIRTSGTVTQWLTGEAIIQTCKIAATRGSLATGSFTFRGTGALEGVTPLLNSGLQTIADSNGSTIMAAGGGSMSHLTLTTEQVQAALDKARAIEYATDADIEAAFG